MNRPKQGFTGEVVGIFIAAQEGQAMQSCQEVKADSGRGLEGDRYYNDQGTFSTGEEKSEITLIESETLEAIFREQAIELGAHENRRNLVTRGVPLNHLVGKTFTVGSTIMVGLRLAEPCGYLENLTRPGVKAALVHRGGLRAKIKESGIVRVGDLISPAAD